MIIHKNTPSVDKNYWLKRLNTQLNEPTNQNSLTVPKEIIKILFCDLKEPCVLNIKLLLLNNLGWLL